MCSSQVKMYHNAAQQYITARTCSQLSRQTEAGRMIASQLCFHLFVFAPDGRRWTLSRPWPFTDSACLSLQPNMSKVDKVSRNTADSIMNGPNQIPPAL